MNVQEIVDRIILLKANRERFSPDAFWRDYKRLRRAFYKSEEWKVLSREVRTGAKCSCRKRCRAIHTHHVQGLFDRPELALSKGNLKAICKKKHMQLEREKRRTDFIPENPASPQLPNRHSLTQPCLHGSSST